MRLSLLFVVLAMGLAGGLQAAAPVFKPVPQVPLPRGFGVNIHTHSSFPTSLSQISEAGFTTIRTNLYWSHVEKERGVYDWTNYDNLMLQMQQAGIRPLLAISFSNPVYKPVIKLRSIIKKDKVVSRVLPPDDPESAEAYARFAAAAANRYRAYNVMWEIWNEPDYYYFWAPTPDAAAYANLATQTCQAIRLTDPSATVLAPSASNIPRTPQLKAWWSVFLKSGAPACITAVSVHPYREVRPPETLTADYTYVRKMVKSATGRSIPLVNSEFGYPITTGNQLKPEAQASYLIRQYMVGLLSGVETSIWYDWRNDGTDPTEKEHNFGVVTRDYTPKPSFFAVRTFTQQVAGYMLSSRLQLPQGSPDDYLLNLKAEDRPQRLMAWSAAKQGPTVKIPLSLYKASAVTLVDMFGQTIQPDIRSGVLHLKLGGMPVYATFQ